MGPWRKSTGSHMRSRYRGPGAAREARKALSVWTRGAAVAIAGSLTETSCAPGSISGRARAASRVEIASKSEVAAAIALTESVERLEARWALAGPGATARAATESSQVNAAIWMTREGRMIAVDTQVRDVRMGLAAMQGNSARCDVRWCHTGRMNDSCRHHPRRPPRTLRRGRAHARDDRTAPLLQRARYCRRAAEVHGSVARRAHRG